MRFEQLHPGRSDRQAGHGLQVIRMLRRAVVEVYQCREVWGNQVWTYSAGPARMVSSRSPARTDRSIAWTGPIGFFLRCFCDERFSPPGVSAQALGFLNG